MITFSCDAYENISYFSDIAQNLLTLMGHSGAVPGALKAEEVPHALSNLQQGLKNHEPVLKNSSFLDDDDSNDKENEPKIGLSKRAIPLVHLLEAAIDKKCDVLWS